MVEMGQKSNLCSVRLMIFLSTSLCRLIRYSTQVLQTTGIGQTFAVTLHKPLEENA